MRHTEAERRKMKAELRSEIRACEENIDGWNEQIRALNHKIEQQREIERQYTTMRSEIENVKARKRSKVSITEVYQGNVKFLCGYSARIYEFLDGQRAVRAGEYIEDASTRMENEINANQIKIEELRSQIARCNRQIDTLENRLRRI